MSNKIEGPDFLMESPEEAPHLRGERYAWEWLTGAVHAPHGKAYSFPLKKDVLTVLRKDPSLLNEFISHAGNPKAPHDSFVLEKNRDGFDVYLTFEGARVGQQHFEDLWDAVDAFFTMMGLR